MVVNQADRREQILAAAFGCFLRSGYAKTAMGDIAAECKLSRPLLYLQFKTKEEIFGAVLTSIFEQCYQRAKAVRAQALGRREMILGVIDAWVFADWDRIVASPHAEELLTEGYRIYPKMEAGVQRRSMELLGDLIGNPKLTEVVLLSLKGLKADRPSGKVLRARAELLIDLVLKAEPGA
jgi:TetR/AcrR family transcriptional regulator, transcriptional repressor of aconitase